MLPFVQLRPVQPRRCLTHRTTLYEQMASNLAFTKRNIQNANAYLLTILVRS